MPGPRLSRDERSVIEAGARVGLPQKQIAEMIGRHPSVVCRELKRAGCPPDGGWVASSQLARPRKRPSRPMRYVAERAHRQAVTRAKRHEPGSGVVFLREEA